MSAGPTLKDVLDRLAASSQPSGLEPGSETFALYAEAIHAAIVRRLAEMGDSEPVLEPGCTTHFNVIDRDGTLVSVTQTLLSMFGSRMMLPRTGLLMNNGIMWFDPEPGRPNSLGPGKRCLSNMCPIILERDDGMRAALGAAGGRKILPAVAQLVSYLLDYRMNLSEAFSTPRMDFSNSDLTIVEVDAPSALLSGLHAKSEQIRAMPRAVFPLHFGCPSAAATLDGEQSAMIEADIPWGEAVAV
jgi:gamma-glutamyltranspeptidase/glutathione hydrolase